MKKFVSLLLVAVVLCSTVLAFASCGKDKNITIAIPDDPSNGLRALQLLQAQGLIELNADADVSDTVTMAIKANPYNIVFKEIKAAQLPSALADVDYAVINSNYAIEAELTPFVTEGTDVSYPNVIAVKEANKDSNKIKALVAAINSVATQTLINNTYKGAVVCDLVNPDADGLLDEFDYAALNGTEIKVGATSVPHAVVLEAAKTILATKNITLTISVFSDWELLNPSTVDGSLDANYFQHVPYMTTYNTENSGDLVSVLEVHHEPLGVYSAKYSDFSAITTK